MDMMAGLMGAVLHWGILQMAGPLEVVKVSLGSLKRGWVPEDVELKKRNRLMIDCVLVIQE